MRRGAALMGICNVTPDSFSDGGRFYTLDAARARIDQLLADGADIVDVGGESTRPGSAPVPPAVQIDRVVPVVAYASARGACVSVDTTSGRVAEAAVEAGAHAINDVSLLSDLTLARVAAARAATLILCHARAPQAAMVGDGGWPLAAYGDVVADVLADWAEAAHQARREGVAPTALVFDPGLGFSKASRHSFELLRRLSELVQKAEGPVLVGASRKSFLTLIEGPAKSAAADRDGGSVAAALHAVACGATILRVHDVRATRQAIDLTHALAAPRRKI